MMVAPINVNQYVYVRLTEAGDAALRRYFETLAGQMSSMLPSVSAEALIKASQQDTVFRRFQLWELMHIFGPEMYHPEQMFVENKIHLD